MLHRTVLISIICILVAGVDRGQEAAHKQLVLDFEGNKIFSSKQLLDVSSKCLAKPAHLRNGYDAGYVDYCLRKVKSFLFDNGYLRAKIGEPRQQETESTIRVVVPIDEGALYRLGDVKIEGSKLLGPAQILQMLSLKPGDVAKAESLSEWAHGRVKKAYETFGYMQYSASLEPVFQLESGAGEGVVDFIVTVDEGEAFVIRSIKFEGDGSVPEDELRKEMLVRIGEVFNKELFDESLKRISQTGQFEVIDADKDVDYRGDNEGTRLDLIIHLKKKSTILE